MFEESQTGKSILRSESYLTSEHTPETPVGRDTEIQRIAEAMQPLSKRRTPDNLLVYGPAGVGKTLCVRHVFDKLDQETRVKTVYINCWQYNTRPSLLTELLIQLGYPAPRKGKPVDELLSKLREWLDRNRGVAVAMDEFDQLEESTEVIYDLQMLNEEADNPVGLLMVSNQHPSQVELDPRSQSRLNCQTLEFNSYTAEHLTEILEQRVQQAFRPGAIPDEVIQEIAERVTKRDGDCREALKLLLQAAREAEKQGESEVTKDLVPFQGGDN